MILANNGMQRTALRYVEPHECARLLGRWRGILNRDEERGRRDTAVGVPKIAPSVLIVSPAGSDPPMRLQVTGPIPLPF
jgi:hypothetical protein